MLNIVGDRLFLEVDGSGRKLLDIPKRCIADTRCMYVCEKVLRQLHAELSCASCAAMNQNRMVRLRIRAW